MKSDKQKLRETRREVRELKMRLAGWGRPGKKMEVMKKMFDKMLPCKADKIIADAEDLGISYSTVMRARIRYDVDTSTGTWRLK